MRVCRNSSDSASWRSLRARSFSAARSSCSLAVAFSSFSSNRPPISSSLRSRSLTSRSRSLNSFSSSRFWLKRSSCPWMRISFFCAWASLRASSTMRLASSSASPMRLVVTLLCTSAPTSRPTAAARASHTISIKSITILYNQRESPGYHKWRKPASARGLLAEGWLLTAKTA